jgi:hypothetical protein
MPHMIAKLTITLTTAALLLLGLAAFHPAHAATPTTIWVDKTSKGGRCADTRDRTTATPTTPLCTLARAATIATPGDTIQIRAATYPETLRPQTSGTPTAPIRYSASEPGVIIDATAKPTAILIIGRTDLRFSGLTINHATAKGIWVDTSARITFDTLVVTANQVGLQAKTTSDLTVQHSTITANTAAGIQELGGVTRGHYLHDHITNNGHDGAPYNGDGLQLDGTNAIVSDCDITGNGDHTLYEHGIYADDTATGYLIEASRFAANAATNIKAQGTGTVRNNTLASARLGMYLDHNSAPGVTVATNTFTGTFDHPIQTGTGALLTLTSNTLNGLLLNLL